MKYGSHCCASTAGRHRVSGGYSFFDCPVGDFEWRDVHSSSANFALRLRSLLLDTQKYQFRMQPTPNAHRTRG